MQNICRGKNDPNSLDFEKTKSKLPKIYDKLQKVVKNIEGF
jgi:hypothetical protein